MITNVINNNTSSTNRKEKQKQKNYIKHRKTDKIHTNTCKQNTFYYKTSIQGNAAEFTNAELSYSDRETLLVYINTI